MKWHVVLPVLVRVLRVLAIALGAVLSDELLLDGSAGAEAAGLLLRLFGW